MRLKPTVTEQDLLEFGFEIISSNPLIAVRNRGLHYGIFIDKNRTIRYNNISIEDEDISPAILDLILAGLTEE